MKRKNKLNKKGTNRKLLLIGILLLVTLISVISALTDDETQAFQDELSRLELDLTNNGYDWLINYSVSYPKIEVYRKNDSNLLATFDEISGEGFYKIFLTNLSDNESLDTFDLRVLNLDGEGLAFLEFDYIVDPKVIIQNVGDQGNLFNVTSEKNNFTHLSVSNVSIGNINSSNVLVYYPFEPNIDTTAYDYSKNNNDGPFENGAFYSNSGTFGGAAEFRDDGSRINVPDVVDGLNDMTVAMWVKPSYADEITTNKILLDQQGTGSDTIVILRITNEVYRLTLFNGTQASITINSGAYLDTDWHHLVATYDGSSAIFYVDGGSAGSALLGGVIEPSPGNDLYISTNTASQSFNGTIDEFMILNKSLNSSEVSSLFGNQSSRFFPSGEQIFNNINVSGDGTENRVNLTINSTTLFGSKINVSVGDSSAAAYSYGSEYAFTNNFVSNINVSTPNNISLRFVFYSGDTLANSFYSPVLQNNVTIDSYTNTASGDSVSPLVKIISPANTTYASLPIVFNISANENSTALYSLNGAPNISMTINSSGTGFWATNDSIADGSYLVNYFVNDTSNNQNNSKKVAFGVDTSIPSVILSAPANNSNFRVGVFNITLNETVLDPNGNSVLKAFIYGVNFSSTGKFYKHGLLYQQIDVSPGSNFTYNWTSPVTVPDKSVVYLLHLDNNSRYDENDSFVYDFSDYNRNNGTASGNAFPNMSGGKFGGGWEFDGNGDYITITDGGTELDFDDLGSYTWTMWAKVDSLSADNYLLTKDPGGVSTDGFIIATNTSGQVILGKNSGGSLDAEVATSKAVGIGSWNHLAVVFNTESNVSIYINGVVNASSSGAFDDNTATNILIGRTSTSALDGGMDEVAFWNRTLSWVEINDLYRLNADRYFWKVNVSDFAGNNNESGVLDIVVREEHLKVKLSTDCPSLLNDAKKLNFGYACSDAGYPTCLGLNTDLNVTSGNVLSLNSSCELFFNVSSDRGYSLYLDGQLNTTGANITSVNSSDKFNFAAFSLNPLPSTSGNISFANFVQQTNVTDSRINFDTVDIEGKLVLLNSSNLISYTIDGGSLERKFRLNTTIYSQGAVVTGANVTARNVSTTKVFSLSSDSEGSVHYNLTQYTDSGSGKTYWNDYIINVTKSTFRENSTTLNITSDKNLPISIEAFILIEVTSTETLHDIFTRVNDPGVFGNLSNVNNPCRYAARASINITAGKLVMEGCTLEVNGTTNGEFYIEVKNILRANNSNFTWSSNQKRYIFYTDPGSSTILKNSYISRTGDTASIGRRGLFINSNNITFDNNTVSHAYDANVEVLANGIELRNSRFIGPASTDTNYNVFIEGNDSKLIDSNLSGALLSDIVVQAKNNLSVLNSSFSSFSVQPGGFLFRQWYVEGLVRDSSGNLISGASVKFNNVTGVLLFTATANSSGYIDKQNVTQYILNGSGRIYLTNYTINASQIGYGEESQSWNVTSSLFLNFSTLTGATSSTILNAPVNNTIFNLDVFDIILNASVFDTNEDQIDAFIYGVNFSSTGKFYKHGLLY
ncbi:hypothetical protein HY450_01410, partial [Candidatus Pacearchaeota archaeon]|nr:hypothetical protein [Candidatus Pacearchaeota archaeon]